MYSVHAIFTENEDEDTNDMIYGICFGVVFCLFVFWFFLFGWFFVWLGFCLQIHNSVVSRGQEYVCNVSVTVFSVFWFGS